MDKAFDAVLQSEVVAAVIAKTSYCFWVSNFVTNVCAVVKKFILPQLIVVNAFLIFSRHCLIVGLCGKCGNIRK